MVDGIIKRHMLFIIMSYAAYYLVSSTLNIHGPNAPVTTAYYGLTKAGQGLIMTMMAVGSLGTSVFISLNGEKYNKVNAIAVGLFIMCIGISAAGFAPAYTVLLALMAAVGVGFAICDIMVNSMISDVYPNHKKTILPLAHAAFGGGQVFTPVIITSIANPDIPVSFSYSFRLFGIIILLVLAIYFFSSRKIMADTPYTDMAAVRKRAAENPAEIFKTGTAWLFIVAGLLFFNYQLGTGMWLPTYGMENAGMDYNVAGMTLTAFFGGSLVLRLLAPLFFRRFTPSGLFVVFGGISAFLMLIMLFMESLPLIMILITAAGVAQGICAPAFIIICTEAFPGRTASAVSLFTFTAYVGSITAPVWMGGMAEYTGFQPPLIIICFAMFVSVFLIIVYSRRKGCL